MSRCRKDDPTDKDDLMHTGLLFLQYLIDQFLKMDDNNNKLNFLRRNQTRLRANEYNAVQRAIRNNANLGNVGVPVPTILPSTFIGSPRNLREHFKDIMAMTQKLKQPSANPNWDEIKGELRQRQTPSDRPDLIARVFRLKVKELLVDIVERCVLGPVSGYVYAVEFQKRGLPHIHLVLWLIQGTIPVESVDHFTCAEIPDPIRNPALYEIVTASMVHKCEKGRCLINGQCSRHFPQKFALQTSIPENIHGEAGTRVEYQRRAPINGGRQFQKNGVLYNNSHIVPFNAFLLLKYRAHINVEVVTSAGSIKYLFTYICKGADHADVMLQRQDEILQYMNARYVGASEAVWHLFEFPMTQQSHQIVRLPVHLLGQHRVVFNADNENIADENNAVHQDGDDNDEDNNNIGNNRINALTQLTEFFTTVDTERRTVAGMNTIYPTVEEILYHDFPLYYCWIEKTKQWKRRILSNALKQIQVDHARRENIRLRYNQPPKKIQ